MASPVAPPAGDDSLLRRLQIQALSLVEQPGSAQSSSSRPPSPLIALSKAITRGEPLSTLAEAWYAASPKLDANPKLRIHFFRLVARTGRTETLQWLLEQTGMANVEKAAKLGDLFHDACFCGYEDIVRWCLSSPDALSIQTRPDLLLTLCQALAYAKEFSSEKPFRKSAIWTVLCCSSISFPLDMNAAYLSNRQTPLFYVACKCRDLHLAKLLLSFGKSSTGEKEVLTADCGI